jgi:calcineurin-like phosphoesterase family protein
MVECWNKVVRPCDKVYHLGDVVIKRHSLAILSRLNGKKRLVRGNHDIFKTADFLEHFEEIYGIRVFSKEGFVATHVPIHPSSLERWKLNVHGHLHSNVVENTHMLIDGTITNIPDDKYMCVSVEQVGYTPVHMDVILERIKAQEEVC